MPKRKATGQGRYVLKRRRKSLRKWGRKRRGQFNKAPMPNIFATKFRYQDVVSINPGAGGTAGVHVFSANGMYDPDVTSTGHQPRGFDQLMAMYDHYVVIGAKITVEFVSPTYDNLVWIALRDDNTVQSDKNEYLEGRNVISALLPADSSSHRRLTKTFSTRKFLGRSKPLSDSQLKGNTGGNPAEQAFFHVGMAPTSTNDEAAHNVNVRIDYLAVLIEPRQPTQS